MTTNLTIIEDSLRDIGVISEIDTASPEQGKFCLRRLNQMMELWKEDDVDIGWFAQTSTTDTIPIPDWAELGVTAALSIAVAPTYGATVSQELIAIADVAAGMILRKSLAEKLTGLDMSHLPVGAGNYRGHRNIITDS
jgi:hypothetical protein